MTELNNYSNLIEVNSEMRFGRPVIKGTRISVYDILSLLKSNLSHKQILDDFPQLTEEQINACVAFAESQK